MFGRTKLSIIETDEALQEKASQWALEKVLAVDLEGDSLHSYKEKICLIQVTDSKQDYIIDPLKINDLRPILELLEDDQILKVMHGADFDIVSLKRDYNTVIHNVFDTLIAAQFLGYLKFSLSHLVREHFGFELEKEYQKHDWSSRPLYEEHLSYARGDTHFLIALYEILNRKLKCSSFEDAVLEECELLTQKEWNGKKNDGADFLRMKRISNFKVKQLQVLRKIYNWREELAAKANVPSFKIFGHIPLVLLASCMPENKADLKEVLGTTYGFITERYGSKILKLVQEGIEDNEPLPKLPKKKKIRPHGQVANITAQIRQWREEKQKKGLLPVYLLSNQQIKEIALTFPKTREELEESLAMREWQKKRYIEELLSILTSI